MNQAQLLYHLRKVALEKLPNRSMGAVGRNQLGKESFGNNTPFRFNGKEWDEETGNFYYGARYYDPKISVWLSVDPLAYKFPNWAPYAFSINNPLLFIDPDGNEVVISGPARKKAFKGLKKALKREGIKLTMQETENGYVLGYDLKDDDATYSQGVSALLMAMDDNRVNLDIKAEESVVLEFDRETGHLLNSNGGSFMGSTYSSSEGGSVSTAQLVVPEFFEDLESAASLYKGDFMLHEATEGAIASFLALSSKTNIAKGSGGNTAYQNADAAAYPQPYFNYNMNYVGESYQRVSSPKYARYAIWSLEKPDQFGNYQTIDFWTEYLPGEIK